jgi:hypothetical protein
MFPAMASIDNHGHSSEQTGNDAIMMDQMIVRMHHVWAVAPQLLCDFPNGAKMRSRRFLKRPHAYAHSGRLCGKPAWMSQAVNKSLMTLHELTAREVNDQPFQATHIEIVDKLYDSHGA